VSSGLSIQDSLMADLALLLHKLLIASAHTPNTLSLDLSQRSQLYHGHSEETATSQCECSAVLLDCEGDLDGVASSGTPLTTLVHNQLADSLVMNCKVDLHREISSRAFTQTLSRLVQDRVGLAI
jgi:hypothetical protein